MRQMTELRSLNTSSFKRWIIASVIHPHTQGTPFLSSSLGSCLCVGEIVALKSNINVTPIPQSRIGTIFATDLQGNLRHVSTNNDSGYLSQVCWIQVNWCVTTTQSQLPPYANYTALLNKLIWKNDVQCILKSLIWNVVFVFHIHYVLHGKLLNINGLKNVSYCRYVWKL